MQYTLPLNFAYCFRTESGVRAEIYEVIENMTGTPISYLVNQTSATVTVQGKEYPIRCGLSYQVNNAKYKRKHCTPMS